MDMNNTNHELLIEIWDRIKINIQGKERLDVADKLVTIFDEFGLLEKSILSEDLDTPLEAAAKSLYCEASDEEDLDDSYDDVDEI